jgi:DNA-directed RNA polymerase subunit K/omega
VNNPETPAGGGTTPAPEEWSQPMNKYILVVVAAQEARRMNEMARQAGREVKERITEIALQRVLDGKVKYAVDEENPS